MSDLARVRFHLGDTDSTTAMFQDEEITMLLSEFSTYQATVIACIQNLLAKLAQERQISADWLTVSPAHARENLQALLAEKRRQFGIAEVHATVGYLDRVDSLEEGSPKFDDMHAGNFQDFDSLSYPRWG